MPEISIRKSFQEQFRLLVELVRWIPVASLAGVMGGAASAVLLASLTLATALRERHVWLVFFLAPAGWLVGLMYRHFGKSVEGGNNLILEQVHDPQDVIPVRMTPLILIGTFVSHLFGGSAGREGTAIQTGASLADQMTRPLRMSPRDRRLLLMAGISAGFGSVFGVPIAGAVFGIEVLAIGKLSYDAIAPCFLSSFIGDLTTRYIARYLPGVHHATYRVSDIAPMSLATILYAGLAGIAFGLVGMGFAKLTHTISHTARRFISRSELRPFAGGAIVTCAVFGFGVSHTAKYIGLGLPTIAAAFESKLPFYDFICKFLFTSVTLGTGFKGGEVTPLFYIGSTLGNALSQVLPLSPSLLAGMGLVAVFAGAANTPLASTFMAFELFGAEAGAYAGIACVVSYLFSGHAGIYNAQRVGKSKHIAAAAEEGLSLALVAKLRQGPQDTFVDDLNVYGYLEGSDMEHLSVLRLYFSASEMRRADSWWRRLAPQSLGSYLLHQAKEHGIEQALLHRVIGGYLKNQDLALDTGEIPPSRLPQCLELVGGEEDLQSFLKHNRDHLGKVRSVFLRGEEARYEAEIEREELEEALKIEHDPHFADTDED
ncbi:voltage-gated chloride channel family protein [Silvibacterium acidisoli]|uniref:voltage-gated chloride channel family protein n=1 Tax=Acidobacteriaceae bacterium ZG23-2 TaxID=2883246 RepID=UPI00406C9EB1